MRMNRHEFLKGCIRISALGSLFALCAVLGTRAERRNMDCRGPCDHCRLRDNCKKERRLREQSK